MHMMADSPVKVNQPGDAPAGPSPEEQKKMEAAYNQMKRKMAISEMGKAIKHKIMVLSGKGGVGKSTVATGLALSLAQQGLKVGLLDIDITGPNVPKMMGLSGRRLNVESGRIHPAQGHLGVKVISMAFLLEDEDTPVVWRGPIKLGAIQQFIGDVDWGELDYLILDLPPGTGDVQARQTDHKWTTREKAAEKDELVEDRRQSDGRRRRSGQGWQRYVVRL